MAAWFALVGGLLEVVVILSRVQFLQNALFRKSPHVLWMAPVSDLAIIASCGWVLALGSRPGSRRARVAMFIVCVLALMTPALAIPGLKAFASLVLAVGSAVWLVPLLEARAQPFARLVRRTLPSLIVIVISLAGAVFARGLRTQARPTAVPLAPFAKAPNVVLIVMDTVRGDAVGATGSRRAPTPNLSAVARRGVRFERAIASAPWTLPSHASLFTGRWAWDLRVGPDRPLDARYPTLAEWMSRQGYATAGFVANTFFCSAEYGLSRGFSHYEDYPHSLLEVFRSSALGWLITKRAGLVLDHVYPALGLEARYPMEVDFARKDAGQINRDALRWIAAQADRPFFAFLNYMDVHDPYLTPPGVDQRLGRRPKTVRELRLLRNWYDLDKERCDPGDIDFAHNAYMDCLTYLDEQLGHLFAGLDRLNRLENTVLIVTSDHGEHFGEHRTDGRPLFGHGLSVYQPEVHVPLLIVAPGKVPAGSVIREPVSLKDIPATIVDLLGRSGDSTFPGTSLASAWRSDRSATEKATRDVLSESLSHPHFPGEADHTRPGIRPARAVFEASKAYHRLGHDREEFYDLDDDPDESRNLVDTANPQGLLDPFRQTLSRLVPSEPPSAPRHLGKLKKGSKGESPR